MGGTCSTCGDEEDCMEGGSRETRRNDKVTSPKYRWKDNIKIDLGKYDGEDVN